MEHDSDEFSEEENFSKKCFDVKIPNNFDPTKCPTTGEEYLQLTMYEAKRCQAVVSVNIDAKKLKPNCNVMKDYDENDTSKVLLPQSWRDKILYEFTRFRNYIQMILKKSPRIHTSFSNEFWIQRISDFPKLLEVFTYDAANQLVLLELLSKELRHIQPGSTISDTIGCWIYTILNLLEIPLSPCLHGIIRELAKKLKSIRSNLDTNDNGEACKPLNFFICIIGVYYKQFDLADNYTV